MYWHPTVATGTENFRDISRRPIGDNSHTRRTPTLPNLHMRARFLSGKRKFKMLQRAYGAQLPLATEMINHNIVIGNILLACK